MAQPDVTTAEAVAAVLRVSNHSESRFAAAYAAAEEYTRRCRWVHVDESGDPLPPPADLVQSVVLLTGRYMARVNSPDGLVGMGELGMMRISAIDRDVRSLQARYRPVVFG